MSLDVSSDTAAGPETAGLRERKKEPPRRLLADVALDLFEARGFDRTTVDDIAAAAEVSPRTFFRFRGQGRGDVRPRRRRAGAVPGAARPPGPPTSPCSVSLREIGTA